MFDLLDAQPAPERVQVQAPPMETPEPKATPKKRKPSKAPAISDEIRAQHRYLVKRKHEWRQALRKSGIKGASAYIVGLYLCDDCANSGSAKLYPRVETIAAELNMPVGTVKDAISALKKAGLLYAKKPRFDGPPDYFLALPKHVRTDGLSAVRSGNEQMEAQPTNGRDFSRRTAGRPSDSTMEAQPRKINHGT
jgi:hypothetical protein